MEDQNSFIKLLLEKQKSMTRGQSQLVDTTSNETKINYNLPKLQSENSSSGSTNRTCLRMPDVSHINLDARIYLKLTINQNGEVVHVLNIPGKSTTTDLQIIHQVIQVVRTQVRYSKLPNAALEAQYIMIQLKAK